MQIVYYKAGILQKAVDVTQNQFEFLISRVGGEGDFLIKDSRVSKPHAKISFLQEENCFLLEDLQSSNGTFYKGDRIFSLYTCVMRHFNGTYTFCYFRKHGKSHDPCYG